MRMLAFLVRRFSSVRKDLRASFEVWEGRAPNGRAQSTKLKTRKLGDLAFVVTSSDWERFFDKRLVGEVGPT